MGELEYELELLAAAAAADSPPAGCPSCSGRRISAGRSCSYACGWKPQASPFVAAAPTTTTTADLDFDAGDPTPAQP